MRSKFGRKIRKSITNNSNLGEIDWSAILQSSIDATAQLAPVVIDYFSTSGTINQPNPYYPTGYNTTAPAPAPAKTDYTPYLIGGGLLLGGGLLYIMANKKRR